MSSRYFVDQPLVPGQLRLRGAEAHHLGRVMRVREGDPVLLFDGQGQEAESSVLAVQRSEVVLQVEQVDSVDRELPFSLVLAVALPRGDRQKWLVEKLVELGVAILVPLVTERGVAQPVPKARERLERTVIEASKQSGRTRLMQVAAPLDVAAWLAQEANSAIRWIAHPGGDSEPITLDDGIELAGTRAAVMVGPEGGFTEAELAAAAAEGWQRIHLGDRILRIETAAMAVAALLACRSV